MYRHGICDQISFIRSEPVEPVTIRRMTQTVVHRNPDDKDYFFDGAHRVWVMLNGEVYNYKELRTKLEQRGHPFRTESDTEVLFAVMESGARPKRETMRVEPLKA